jgi:hypothetical protein
MNLAPAQPPKRSGGRKAKDHGDLNSDSWCSPPEVAEPLFDFWGWADLDPCSNERSIIKARTIYTTAGLILPWKKKTYQNHPYSQNDPWSAKAIAEMKAQRVKELVILCMTASSTLWWSALMHQPRRNPRVICTKRIPFLDGSGEPGDSSRFEPALIYYGPNTARFDRHFRHLARWSTWGR